MQNIIVIISGERKRRYQRLKRSIESTGFPPPKMEAELLFDAGIDPSRPVYSAECGTDTLFSNSGEAIEVEVARRSSLPGR